MEKTKLRHVVLFGFKDGTTEADVDEVVRRFAALADSVPGIEAFEWGINNSPEGLDQGHTHSFVLTFASEAARDAYLPHPQHAAFGTFVRERIENVTVVDYWAQTVK